MKTIFLVIGIAISFFAYAQAPDAVSYQAVIRNSAGNILSNQNISVRFTVLQGTTTGQSVYAETHSISTNNFGSISLAIGTGTALSGNFATIDWGNGPYFLEVAVDSAAGSNFVTISATQFLSVPYALYANSTSANCIKLVEPVDFVFQSDSFYLTNNQYQCTYQFSTNLLSQLTSNTCNIKTSVNGVFQDIGSWTGVAQNGATIYGGAVNVSAGDLVEITWYLQTETCQLKFVHTKQL